MSTFQENLAVGQMGESAIAKWCISRGNSVLPVYEKQIDTGKGPQLFTANGQFVAPDMFVMPSMHWIEAKHKSHFTWYRKARRWVTGIDLHHYKSYLRVQEISRRPVWLLFLHRDPTPHPRDQQHGCPPRCPIGLFGNGLTFLSQNKSHESGNWGRHGMIYWAHSDLKMLATIEQIENLEQQLESA